MDEPGLRALFVAPLMPAGSRAGARPNGRISERGFTALVCALVFASGCVLLLRYSS
jgi:uncharacterized membrane protein YfcA